MRGRRPLGNEDQTGGGWVGVFDNFSGSSIQLVSTIGTVLIIEEERSAPAPETDKPYLTAWKEVVLKPREQGTLPPDTKHWFQAGDEGCNDVFTDPRVNRIPDHQD